MKRCKICGCIIDDADDDICDCCKDEIEEIETQDLENQFDYWFNKSSDEESE